MGLARPACFPLFRWTPFVRVFPVLQRLSVYGARAVFFLLAQTARYGSGLTASFLPAHLFRLVCRLLQAGTVCTPNTSQPPHIRPIAGLVWVCFSPGSGAVDAVMAWPVIPAFAAAVRAPTREIQPDPRLLLIVGAFFVICSAGVHADERRGEIVAELQWQQGAAWKRGKGTRYRARDQVVFLLRRARLSECFVGVSCCCIIISSPCSSPRPQDLGSNRCGGEYV